MLLSAVAVAACDHERKDELLLDIGVRENSVERLPDAHVPIPRGDLATIGEVGQWLFLATRGLALAHAQVVERMGEVDRDLVLPLVDIDPAGTSGQVVFIRWPDARGRAVPPTLDEAQRWVLVSLAFGPDRVLDVELLERGALPGTVERRRVQAQLVAAKTLQERAPGAAFYTVDRFQTEPTGLKRKPQRLATVIHAIAQGDQGPDFELAIDEPRKGKQRRDEPPPVVRELAIHARGALAVDPVVTTLPDPHPITVMRAMQAARALHVRAASGDYEIAADGTVTRTGASP